MSSYDYKHEKNLHEALGHTDVRVRISKTGWPSKGDVDEPEATRNYGLYYPDGSHVYNLGVQGYIPHYSSLRKNAFYIFRLLVLLLGSLLFA
nr:hypothetical protein [Tanacetum cinerariifolium]